MDASFIKALNIISNISPVEKKTVGDIMVESDILSNEFVYVHNGEVTLFHDDKEDNKIVSERWKKILSFIGLIQNLRSENLIFLQPVSSDNWIYGKDLTDFRATQNPNEYKLANDAKLISEPAGLKIKKGNQVYSEISINSDISKALCNYILCSVYPASQYTKFRERGYITPMEYSLNLSRKANNWALRAFIIAIISFLTSPFLFNWFGYSTINGTQFKQLLDSISQYNQSSSNISLNYQPDCHFDSGVDATKKVHYVLREKQK